MSADAFLPFRVEVHPERESVRVVAVGEIDLNTIAEVDEKLRELQDAGFARLVLDLRRLTFIDSTGLSMVLAWTAAAHEDGIGFHVVPGPRAVQRVFEIAGVLDRVPFVTMSEDPGSTGRRDEKRA